MLHSSRIGSGEAKRSGGNGETKSGGPLQAGQRLRQVAHLPSGRARGVLREDPCLLHNSFAHV